jgi:hypothetical protein
MNLVKKTIGVIGLAVMGMVFLVMPAAAQDSSDVRGNVYGNSMQSGNATGNATGEGEASFTMSFTGKGRTEGDFKGTANSVVDGAGSAVGSDK